MSKHSLQDWLGLMVVILITHTLFIGVGLLALVGGLIIEHNPFALFVVGMSLVGLIAFWAEYYDTKELKEK